MSDAICRTYNWLLASEGQYKGNTAQPSLRSHLVDRDGRTKCRQVDAFINGGFQFFPPRPAYESDNYYSLQVSQHAM